MCSTGSNDSKKCNNHEGFHGNNHVTLLLKVKWLHWLMISQLLPFIPRRQCILSLVSGTKNSPSYSLAPGQLHLAIDLSSAVVSTPVQSLSLCCPEKGKRNHEARHNRCHFHRCSPVLRDLIPYAERTGQDIEPLNSSWHWIFLCKFQFYIL